MLTQFTNKLPVRCTNNPKDYLFLTTHGYNVRDGAKGTTDKMVPIINKFGLNALAYDYGYFDLLKVRFATDSVARALAEFINAQEKPAVVFGHSHGNVILHLAAKKYNANIVYHVGIQPALNVETVFADQIKKIDTYFNAGDWTVWASKVLRVSTHLISKLYSDEPHWWGETGRVGLNKNPINDNIDTMHTDGLPSAKGHSTIFKDQYLRYWAIYMIDRVLTWIENTKWVNK